MIKRSLWKCDDGSFDVIEGFDEDGCIEVVHYNVPEHILACAPELLNALRVLVLDPKIAQHIDPMAMKQAMAALAKVGG